MSDKQTVMNAIQTLEDSSRVDVQKKLAALSKVYNSSTGSAGLRPASQFLRPEVISTGIPAVDHKVLGLGGIPIGRVHEIAGETSAGKSTFCLNVAREFINAGKTVVLAENEGHFDREYARKIGIDPDLLVVHEGRGLGGEEYLQNVLYLIESGFDLLVLDSIQGIVPCKYSESGLDGLKMNVSLSVPKLTASFFRLLKGGWAGVTPAHKGKIVRFTDFKCTMLIVNHLKVVESDSQGYERKDTGGGEDIKFIYTCRLFLELLGVSKEKDTAGVPLYTRVKFTSHKNKLGVPRAHDVLFCDSRTGRFLSDASVLVDLALAKGLISVSSSWIEVVGSIPDCPGWNVGDKVQGKSAFESYCRTMPSAVSYIMRFVDGY